MHRHVIGAAAALAFVSAAAPGLARNPPPPSAPPAGSAQAPAATPAVPAAPTRYSIDTRFGDLFADPNAAKVVREFFRKRRIAAGKPEQTPEDQASTMEMVKDMTPREVAQYPQADLDDAALEELDAALAKVPYPTQQAAAPAPSPAARSASASAPQPPKP
jgi:hypothetical protein